jgi:hypothetical protein
MRNIFVILTIVCFYTDISCQNPWFAGIYAPSRGPKTQLQIQADSTFYYETQRSFLMSSYGVVKIDGDTLTLVSSLLKEFVIVEENISGIDDSISFVFILTTSGRNSNVILLFDFFPYIKVNVNRDTVILRLLNPDVRRFYLIKDNKQKDNHLFVYSIVNQKSNVFNIFITEPTFYPHMVLDNVKFYRKKNYLISETGVKWKRVKQ